MTIRGLMLTACAHARSLVRRAGRSRLHRSMRRFRTVVRWRRGITGRAQAGSLVLGRRAGRSHFNHSARRLRASAWWRHTIVAWVYSCRLARASRSLLSLAPFNASSPCLCSLATRHYRACSGWLPRVWASCRPLSLRPFGASASYLCSVAACHGVGVLVQMRSCVGLAYLN